MKPKVALTVIAKASDNAEAESLAKMLGSVNGYVDYICIQLNAPKGVTIDPEMKQVADMFADFYTEYDWTGSFVAARNEALKMVPEDADWVMWLDADDLVQDPQNIIPSLAVMPEEVHGVYILYDYQKDEYGNILVSHWNVRAVRNDNSYAWKSSFDDGGVSVHETLIAKRSVKAVANDEWKVVHNASPGHYKESLLRNIKLLEGMAKRQAKTEKGVDPRILFYLGSHYNESYRFNEALELFIQYLKVSGWAEERAEAHVYVGRILKAKGNYTQARNAFLQAIGENPEHPGAYLELGKLEAKEERWKQAVEWLKRGVEVKSPITPMVRYSYDFDLYTEYANALANLGGKHIPKAFKMAQEALKLRPYDPQAKENRDSVSKLAEYRNLTRAANTLIREYEDDSTGIIRLLDALPERLQDAPLVVQTRNANLPQKQWPKRSLAIYVGNSPLGIWGPWSLDLGGLGGSEEAVVRLGRELTTLGWDVTVYGTPGKKAGDIDGVHWRQYWEINNKDEFDVLISWRQPSFFDFEWKARKTYLWLHDVVEPEELTPERLERITKIIYVSKYHSTREESADVPASKKLASGNGIDPATFMPYDGKFKRNPHRVIYMSANERGLRILLDIWPDIRAAVPNATLTPFYGWHSFDAINRDNPERMAWKATMVARMKELDGVEESVRIGQDDLVKEMFKAGVWAYPSFFPEVSCITAMKAQAAGCWPVTSTFAALEDNVLAGDRLDMRNFSAKDIVRYKEALIHRLKNPPKSSERRALMQQAREHFDWKQVAKQWDGDMA
jgi:tetratricopeptide (TPR) repeat protein